MRRRDHWPFRGKKGTCSKNPENFVPPDIPATWGAMENLYGKVRAIGMSNFSSKKLGDLVAVARVPPAVNQVECHPGWQQTKLHSFCQSAGVHLSAYSPLGSPGSPRMNGNVLKDAVVISIAEKLGKTPAQVALRCNTLYIIQHSHRHSTAILVLHVLPLLDTCPQYFSPPNTLALQCRESQLRSWACLW
ncbi:hypothetical protein ACP70R_008212 [Stipagrostis hirtigluma subsp. patula]